MQRIRPDIPTLLRKRYRLPVIGEWLSRRRILRRYKRAFGEYPQLDPPRTFNERITHRLLYDRDPRLQIISDKIEVKAFLAQRVPHENIVPLLGQWSDARDIDFEILPDAFVLKPSFACGRTLLVPDKRRLDTALAVRTANNWLKRNYYDWSSEWGYRDLPHRLMAEPFMMNAQGGPAQEISVHIVRGRPGHMFGYLEPRGTPDRKYIALTATGKPLDAFADPNHAQIHRGHARQIEEIRHWREDVVSLALMAAKDFDYMRVDFYLTPEAPRIGELTPYTSAGRENNITREIDLLLGRCWEDGFDLDAHQAERKSAN
ncbi:MAG: ATP-grasp fold amidoligase family protein [Pseudomonadota bacterium]